MFGFDLRSPQRLATSSGSVSLNSPFVPSQVMDAVSKQHGKKYEKIKEKKKQKQLSKPITFRFWDENLQNNIKQSREEKNVENKLLLRNSSMRLCVNKANLFFFVSIEFSFGHFSRLRTVFPNNRAQLFGRVIEFRAFHLLAQFCFFLMFR